MFLKGDIGKNKTFSMAAPSGVGLRLREGAALRPRNSIYGRDGKRWIQAITSEMQSLDDRNTWRIETPRSNAIVIGSQLIFGCQEECRTTYSQAESPHWCQGPPTENDGESVRPSN